MLAGEFVEQIGRLLPSTLISTFRRPRWAMPNTTSRVPFLPAWRTISFSIGTSASPPSSEKRLAPGNLAPGNVRAFRRGQLVQETAFSSAVKLARPTTDSMRCWIQRFSSVLVMCMYSAPIDPQ